MSDVAEAVVQMIADEMDVPRADLPTDVPLRELGIDSITLFSFQITIEERFGIVIPDEQFLKIRTIDDLVAFIRADYPGVVPAT
ncbi:MAG: acyl carrier protein [Vicinamibacterales bacterium]